MLSTGLFAVSAIAFFLAWVPALYCDWAMSQDPTTLPQFSAALCKSQPAMDSTLAWLAFSVALIGAVIVRTLSGAKKPPPPAPTRIARPTHRTAPTFHDVAAPVGSSAKDPVVAIDIDEELDLGPPVDLGAVRSEVEEDPDSLMAFVQARVVRSESEPDALVEHESTLDGFYCPPGMARSPILYVDLSYEESQNALDDDQRVDNPEHPFKSVERALLAAQKLCLKPDQRVQVRLMPGVYQTALQIPDRVVLVNHRMPAEGNKRQREAWLADQSDIDHPERVTILAPANSDATITFLPGRLQGLFGCQIVGREGVAQLGIRAAGCMALVLLHCAVEGFSQGGIEITDCGEDLPGRQTTMMGCRLSANTSAKGGGALHVLRSALRLEDCVFESNTAPIGGAILARNLKSPLLLQGCTLSRNRALTRQLPEGPLLQLKLAEWKQSKGLGGAVALVSSLLKVIDSRFEGNDASVGGGAVVALASRVVLQSGDQEAFVENRALAGGAILAIGWADAQSVIKSHGANFKGCLAKHFGGAIALIGLSAAQFEEGDFEANRCTDPESVGAAIFCHKGASLQGRTLTLQNNRAQGNGGAIGAINASIRLTEGCILQRNSAELGEGGAIYCVTSRDTDVEQLVSAADFSLPFTLSLADVTIQYNRAHGLGAGLRAGNSDAYSTFSLDVELEKPETIWNNRSALPDGRDVHDVWITWAGNPRVTSREKLPVKMLLS